MLHAQNTGLIVVDIQGKLARLVHDSDTLISNCEKLIKGAQALNIPIIYLEQNTSKLGTTTPVLNALLSHSDPIEKFTFNACDEPNFIDAVKSTGIQSWLVCGIEAHICVYQTAVGLDALGFEVELVSDCVSSRTLANKQLSINRLTRQGIPITGLEMCLYELVKDCRAPVFKDVLSLIK